MEEEELIVNMDARVWAKEFINLIKEKPDMIIDEYLMIAWFANAIMTGYDKGIKDCIIRNLEE